MAEDDLSKLGFSAAMDELEGILRRIEGEQVDIDELAVELERAAKLLDVCRTKIRRAEVEVSQIVQTLDPEKAEESEPEEGSQADGDESEGGETASLFPDEE